MHIFNGQKANYFEQMDDRGGFSREIEGLCSTKNRFAIFMSMIVLSFTIKMTLYISNAVYVQSDETI